VKISLEKGEEPDGFDIRTAGLWFHVHSEGTLSELHTATKWRAQGRLEKAMIAKAV
jgi:hypothetical protein